MHSVQPLGPVVGLRPGHRSGEPGQAGTASRSRVVVARSGLDGGDRGRRVRSRHRPLPGEHARSNSRNPLAGGNPLVLTVIIATEIAFWLLLLSGLVARYGLGRPRLGFALLAATPFVDLAARGHDHRPAPRRGGRPAARARRRLHRRLRGVGATAGRVGRCPLRAPVRRRPGARWPPRTGRRHAAHQRREWLRHLVAWATGTALLGLGVLLVGDPDRTWALQNVAALWTLVLAIDFAISFSYTLWPRGAAGARSAADEGHLDLGQVGGLGGAELRVAVGAGAPDVGDRGGQLLVGGAAAQERPQVVALDGEQAGVDLAVRREAARGCSRRRTAASPRR